MIFAFDERLDVIRAAATNKLSGVVAEMARAHRAGYHLLIIDRAVARWFEDNLDLSTADRAMVRKIGADFTQVGGLPANANIHAKILVDYLGPPAIRNGRVEIGLDSVRPETVGSKTIIIAENGPRDGRLLDYAMEQVRRHIRATRIDFEIQNGGGSSTYEVFAQKIIERRIVGVIVDSDKKYPTAPTSDSTRKILKVQTDHNWPLCLVTILPCHEIENLIPLNIIQELPVAAERAADIAHLQSISDLEDAEQCPGGQRLWHWLDLKEGVTSEYAAQLKNPHHRQWLSEKLAKLPVGTVLLGFGGRLVPQVLSSNRTIACFAASIKNRSWMDHFAGGFEGVLWLCAAAAPQLT